MDTPQSSTYYRCDRCMTTWRFPSDVNSCVCPIGSGYTHRTCQALNRSAAVAHFLSTFRSSGNPANDVAHSRKALGNALGTDAETSYVKPINAIKPKHERDAMHFPPKNGRKYIDATARTIAMYMPGYSRDVAAKVAEVLLTAPHLLGDINHAAEMLREEQSSHTIHEMLKYAPMTVQPPHSWTYSTVDEMREQIEKGAAEIEARAWLDEDLAGAEKVAAHAIREDEMLQKQNEQIRDELHEVGSLTRDMNKRIEEWFRQSLVDLGTPPPSAVQRVNPKDVEITVNGVPLRGFDDLAIKVPLEVVEEKKPVTCYYCSGREGHNGGCPLA